MNFSFYKSYCTVKEKFTNYITILYYILYFIYYLLYFLKARVILLFNRLLYEVQTYGAFFRLTLYYRRYLIVHHPPCEFIPISSPFKFLFFRATRVLFTVNTS